MYLRSHVIGCVSHPPSHLPLVVAKGGRDDGEEGGGNPESGVLGWTFTVAEMGHLARPWEVGPREAASVWSGYVA